MIAASGVPGGAVKMCGGQAYWTFGFRVRLDDEERARGVAARRYEGHGLDDGVGADLGDALS